MRSFKIYFSIATFLLILYVVAEYNKPSPLNWSPTLSSTDKIPFGTYILYHEINQIFPGSKLTNTNDGFYNLFHDKDSLGSNYLILSKNLDFNKYDLKELFSYIREGNSVFIASAGWKNLLGDTLGVETGFNISADTVGLNFTNSKLRQPKDYRFGKGMADAYFDDFDTAHAVVLGKNQFGKSNLLRYDFGKGSLYVCADPELFTNYSLLNKRGADYAAKALSYMPVRPVIYWDHFQNGDIIQDMSPVRVFFAHSGLKWAYYISFFGIFIFILYEMKRRQRIIPVIEPLRNSTLDFVNVVGRVYYEQRNNMNIAQKKILFFLEHVRTRYSLKTSVLDAEFMEKLSHKTGMQLSFIRDLINHINYVSVQRHINDRELILLNQLIEQFNTQSK